MQFNRVRFFPRMRSEGFPFIVWGSGGWDPCSLRLLCARAVVARRRVSSRVGAGCVVNSVPLGPAFRACRVCLVCGAVPWGLLLGRSRGCRCAVGIAAGLLGVSRGRRCAMGIAAGLLGVSRGRRRVLEIADQGVVWVAPCLKDC